MKIIGVKNYRKSEWSGGTTTEIIIDSCDEVYADKTFLYRISSATVEVDTTKFTPLDNYIRYISVIDGEMILNHGMEDVVLSKYEVHKFDGKDKTVSKGRCVDFNLMVNKCIANSNLEFKSIMSDETLSCAKDSDTVIYFVKGSAKLGETLVKEGETVVFWNECLEIDIITEGCLVYVATIQKYS